MKNVAVIGAGAAGCFSAIRLKRMRPEWTVTLLEAGAKPLAKVAVTGEGAATSRTISPKLKTSPTPIPAARS